MCTFTLLALKHQSMFIINLLSRKPISNTEMFTRIQNIFRTMEDKTMEDKSLLPPMFLRGK